jgi:hypothetical protein
MDPDNITPNALPDNGGEGAVEEVVQAPNGDATKTASPDKDTLSLSEINSILGKQFPDKATALKALKDTQSYVGKKEEDVAKDLREKGFLTREELENELFYRDNPDYSAHKDTIEAIAKSKGISTKEAANSESFKNLFEGATKYEETKKMKSVLEPSPRLRQAMDRASTVNTLKSQGRAGDAAQEAARAVIEAFELDQ